MATDEQNDLRCNGCAIGMRWGEEYQLTNSGCDRDAVCRDCRGDFEEAV